MAEITDISKIIDLQKRLKRDETNKRIDQTKFIAALVDAYPENLDFLESEGIFLQPSQWLILAIEPEVLKKTVLRAKDLGFIDAYIQNPAFLKQNVEEVTKRMSLADAKGIVYKNEKGKYLSFLFSKRGFNFVLGQSEGYKDERSDDTPSVTNIELLEAADRVMEAVNLEAKKDSIYKNIALMENEGYGIKEILMASFAKASGNADPEFLGSVIDDVLSNIKDEEMRRAA